MNDDIDEYLYGEDTAKNLKEAPPLIPLYAEKGRPLDETSGDDKANDLFNDDHSGESKPFGAINSEESSAQEIPNLPLTETSYKFDENRNYIEEDYDIEDEGADVELVLEETDTDTNTAASTFLQQLTSITTTKSEVTSSQIASTLSMSRANALDVNKTAEYEGQSIFNIDLDSFEDKPWRKPGADLSDYFNFGFDENSWRQYCHKQKVLRDENLLLKKIQVHETVEPLKPRSTGPITRHGFGPKPTGPLAGTTPQSQPLRPLSATGNLIPPRTTTAAATPISTIPSIHPPQRPMPSVMMGRMPLSMARPPGQPPFPVPPPHFNYGAFRPQPPGMRPPQMMPHPSQMQPPNVDMAPSTKSHERTKSPEKESSKDTRDTKGRNSRDHSNRRNRSNSKSPPSRSRSRERKRHRN